MLEFEEVMNLLRAWLEVELRLQNSTELNPADDGREDIQTRSYLNDHK